MGFIMFLVRSEGEERERRRGPVREETGGNSRREVIRESTGLAPGKNLVEKQPNNQGSFVFRSDWTGDGRR